MSDSGRLSTREQREFNVKTFGGATGVLFVMLMAALIAHSQSMSNHSGILFRDLTIVFALFVASISVFAVLYQYLYKTDALHFFFNEAIALRQKEIVQSKSGKELALLANEIVLMSELLTPLVERKATVLEEFAPYEVTLPSGVRYSFSQIPGPGANMPGVFMQVVDDGGMILLAGCFIPYGRCPQNAEEFITVTRIGINNCSRRSLELEERIASLSTDSPKVWSIIDFIYLSKYGGSTDCRLSLDSNHTTATDPAAMLVF